MKEQMYKIELRDNNIHLKDNCAICGRFCEQATPINPYIRDTREPTCEDCTRIHAPELALLLDTLYNAPGAFEYHRALICGEIAKKNNDELKPYECDCTDDNMSIQEPKPQQIGNELPGVDGRYQVFIPISGRYYMSTSADSTKHELLGFMVWNRPGLEPNEKIHIMPVTSWNNMENIFIFPNKLMEDFPF